MELANIEQLLKKYENAETSLQEEAILKNYFSREDIAPHLYEYKALFNYFEMSGGEKFTKTIPLKRKRTSLWWLSIAASVVLVSSVYFMNTNTDISASDQKEAELALLETQKAFQLISENLNKGGNAAANSLSEFNKAQNKVFKKSN